MRVYILLSVLFTVASYAQDMFDVKTSAPKTYLRAEVFENYVRYASDEDIRAKKDIKQTYFYILGNLAKPISYEKQLQKWNIVQNLVQSYEGKSFQDLLSLYLESENEVREGIACALWKKSISEKKSSSQSLSFIEELKEQLEETENNTSNIISSYFVMESVMQSVVNDDVVADFYHMIYSPESTSLFDDEEGLIETFEFSPIGYIADYYGLDFKNPILNKVLNRVVYFDKKENSSVPLRKSGLVLMMYKTTSSNPSLENKTNETIEFSQIDNKGKNIGTYSLGPNHMFSFSFGGMSQMIRIKLNDGREYQLTSYKKYQLEKKQ